MLMRRLQLLGVGVASLLLFSCGNATRQGGRQGDTLSLHHARLLTVVEQGHGLQAIVADPWQQGHVLQRYDTPGALRRVVVFTAAHCQLLVASDWPTVSLVCATCVICSSPKSAKG